MKPGLRVLWEVPGPGCLIMEVGISATLPSWDEAEEGGGIEPEVGDR